MSKKSSLQSLINIGPKITERLINIGINTKEDFLAKDPYEVFEQLLKVEPDLCRCALASIIGASQSIPWHVITKDTAKEFEKRNPNHKWINHC